MGDLAVDFDLGELVHGPAGLPPQRTRPSGGRPRRGPRRTLVALAAVALVSAAAGWQVGANRADTSRPAAPRPAVLGWLEDNGPNLSSTAADPSEDLVVHVTNLGGEPVHVRSVVAHTPRNPVDLRPTVVPQVSVLPGRSTEVVLVAHAACRSTYPSASLSLQLQVTGADGTDRAVEVPVIEGAGAGVAFRDVLNRLCLHPTPDAETGGVDGVYLQSTFTAEQATLILDNRTAEPRLITFAAERSSVFDLQPLPRGPILLPPGQSASATVRVRVLSCHDLSSLDEWADSALLEVRRGDRPTAAPDGSPGLTTFALKDLLLATMGAAVQRSCGTASG